MSACNHVGYYGRLGKVCQIRPGLFVDVRPHSGLQNYLMLGRLAVPKTLDMKGQILSEIIRCDPLGFRPSNPPGFLSSSYSWIFGSDPSQMGRRVFWNLFARLSFGRFGWYLDNLTDKHVQEDSLCCRWPDHHHHPRTCYHLGPSSLPNHFLRGGEHVSFGGIFSPRKDI